ncbi:MAG: agmatinase [Patescibacteria group bacterium]
MMVDSIISAKKINESDVVILLAGYEKTVSSKKGASKGPKKVLEMLDSKIEFFDRTYKTIPSNKIKIGEKNLGIMKFFSPEKVYKKITLECEKLLKNNKFIFLLGGEHSVSLGHLKALTTKINPKEVTIVQIDAHCDLRDNDSDYSKKPSKFAHSCVARRAHELGYNLIQIGIRTYSIDEYNYFSDPQNNITVFEWGVGKKIPTIEEIIGSIKTKYVYITIDIDGFDPKYMPGTGTPVQGGLDWWYGIELIENIIDKKDMIGADIVEVSPVKDSVLTEYGAAQLCYTMIAHKFRDKLIS